jgi:choice-of-anchor B domain-containing protein
MRFTFTLIALFSLLLVKAQTPCVDGFAGGFPCDRVDLLGFLSLAEIEAQANTNDIWGWTHITTGREFALIGKNNGTAFVEVTDPVNPVYIGSLPTHTTNSLWRDIKVFADYAFIVAEAGEHGMQVFDLNRLVNATDLPITFDADAHYNLFGRAHNIAINEESGFAYAVGSQTFAGGLHIVDINDPLNPVIAGDFAEDGYTHDTQVVIYSGPDLDYCGQEIAFCANENTVTIVNVTDKLDTYAIAIEGYTTSAYTHQCWLTEDQKYLLVNDELDEMQGIAPTTFTYIFDVQDLDNPFLLETYEGTTPSIDHNLYVKWNMVFQSNYRSGLRILDASRVSEGSMVEVGYFDVIPSDDNPTFQGSWSNYPYFESGIVLLTDMFGGFFVVQPRIATADVLLTAVNDLNTVSGNIYLSYAPETYELLFTNLPVGVVADFETLALPGNIAFTLTGVDDLDFGDYSFGIQLQHDEQLSVFGVTLTRADQDLQAVAAIAPVNSVENPEVTLSWSANVDATSYEVTVATDSAFQNEVFNTTTNDTQVVIPFSLPDGVYFWKVELTGVCDLALESEVATFDVLFVGVNEAQKPALTLSPNPATNTLQLNYTGASNEAQIWSVYGQLVHNSSVRLFQGSNAIDISALAPGSYVLRLTTGEQVRFVKL